MLERTGIQKINDERINALVAQSPHPLDASDFIIVTSSGTSGRNVLMTVRKVIGPPEALPFDEQFGFTSRTLCIHGSNGARLFSTMHNAHSSHTHIMHVLPHTISPEICSLISQFKPEFCIGLPSVIASVGAGMDVETRRGVRIIRLAGDMLTERAERQLLDLFPNASLWSIYALSEIGMVSSHPCGNLPRNTYHPRHDVEVAIVEPDEAGIGEIVVTMRSSTGEQLAAYRTGDIGRFIEGACPCGAHTSFQVLGRAGFDYLKFAGALLRREELDRVMEALHSYDEYLAEVTRIEAEAATRWKMVLSVWRSDGVGTSALAREIAERVARELYMTPTQTLSDLIEKGMFLPLEVVFSPHRLIVPGKKDIRLRLWPESSTA